ncbi:putative RNA polymerase II subunit B1 CTD phosphatase rpap2 isoform X4 [Nelusetta ayraudi]|uniref:putative RNA polymerase II subunit B1 CTD phosphatase rpap2 isoform X4 n=1 Tax=Nelusetta ayraudi TaxID=303726 RepID=UPI003F6F3DFD
MEEKRGSKVSKKGGKRAKALTAEEEAKRREELKEKLSEKLELERRALKVVERLLEDSVSEDFLIDCGRLITAANYKDVIEERTIAKLCGYPLCPNSLGQIRTQKYKICTRTNKVYDITERKCFCSNFCYKASKDFELQISNTPLWLRQHENPKEIKLMKKGIGGSSGEEVVLSERCLQEKDIEDPLATQAEDLLGSGRHSAATNISHSDGSDMEEEQEFVSSVVSQGRGRRTVHWDDLPHHKDRDKPEQRSVQRQETQTGEPSMEDQRVKCGDGIPTEDENRLKLHLCKSAVKEDVDNQHLSLNAVNTNGDKISEDVENATRNLHLCSLSDAAPRLVDSASVKTDGPACADGRRTTESELLPSTSHTDGNPDSHQAASANPNISQVGMSKRGAAALRDLLRCYGAAAKPDTIRLKLLGGLRRTFEEWCTAATQEFLYGSSCPHRVPSPKVSNGKEEEELDEDDLADDATDEDGQGASAKVPDYEKLREEVQQQEQRVRGFYKGTWSASERVEDTPGEKQVTAQDRSTKDPVLPLVDSQAQHLIQKRITVERLNSCLRNIVGPLRLTMNNISTDLNNLVRTFRFTNTNIIHKAPQWTLIAVVLLHLNVCFQHICRKVGKAKEVRDKQGQDRDTAYCCARCLQ